MQDDITVFVGLDVRKDSIAVAAADAGRCAPRFIGTCAPNVQQLCRTLAHLGKPAHALVAYEAGPTGFALASYLRSGELTPVTIPDARDEAIRDLSRAREDAVRARLKARQQLKAMLLRHGKPYFGKTSWGPTHERFLARIAFDHPASRSPGPSTAVRCWRQASGSIASRRRCASRFWTGAWAKWCRP